MFRLKRLQLPNQSLNQSLFISGMTERRLSYTSNTHSNSYIYVVNICLCRAFV